QKRQAGAVEMDAIQVLEVDILLRLAGVGLEVEYAVLRVDGNDPAGPEGARRDGVLELAGPVVQVEVAPAAALRPPDHLFRLVEVADRLGLQQGVLEALGEQALGLAGRAVGRAELDVAAQAVAADEAQLVRGLAPVEVGVALVLPLRRYAGELP